MLNYDNIGSEKNWATVDISSEDSSSMIFVLIYLFNRFQLKSAQKTEFRNLS